MEIEPYLSELQRTFHKRGVILAYLFGSQAEGTAGPLSDVDIAVLLGPEVPRERWGDVQLDLIGDLASLFHRDDVDVVILNRASPLLAHRVTTRGQVIYEPDPLARTRFEVEALRRYVDTEPLRRLRWTYLGRRARQRQKGQQVMATQGEAKA
ncbi:MAG: nucleotidyltransferase domain-containing protein [Anaerolineae bacterium]|nr:nucleotidyltransferase domain-containing protein [Anaerolineae bacterium]MDH7473553.1 nucleotidyltransferase domain-containing protein [Anaerolineae bacterium]